MFSCARTLPSLHASKEHPIRRSRVQRQTMTKGVSSPFCFFGMSKESAVDMFGLATCCTKYGTVGENVRMTEDDEEFDDWYLLINFEN